MSLVYTDGQKQTYALRDVSVELPKLKFVGIMGPSGSGKSSLLYILSGLKRPTHGDVSFEQSPYSKKNEASLVSLRRSKFGFVFQQPYLLPWQSALENVMLGAPKYDNATKHKAEEFLETLGIASLQFKLPPELSGGEKQRVCVARAMMNDPDIIFADEPTASLDHANGHTVIELLASYKTKGTVVVVTHDPEMLNDADAILMMRDGMVQGWTNSV